MQTEHLLCTSHSARSWEYDVDVVHPLKFPTWQKIRIWGWGENVNE